MRLLKSVGLDEGVSRFGDDIGSSRKRARAFVAGLCAIAGLVAAHATFVAAPGDAVADFSDVRQQIDGFGGSDKRNPLFTDAEADLFFSTSRGIGLSILRVAVDPNGNYWNGTYGNATKAAARGAIVWGAPWSPPAAWKDNGSLNNGGHLLPAFYDAWASRLANFADLLQQNAGVPLYGISVQNEPDYSGSNTSAYYTPQEMTNFVKVLGPKLAALTPRPKLIAPDTASWDVFWGLTDAIMADPVAAPYSEVLATHQYFGTPGSRAIPPGRRVWQTEMSSFEPFTTDIGNGIMVAKWIHDALVNGSASAWHYWWLIGLNADNEGLLNLNRVPTKRLYTLGNFSKFIRPGFVRVGTAGGPSGVYVSAYKDPVTGSVVVVAINDSGSTVPFGVTMIGTTADTVTPWVTSATQDLASRAPIGVSGGRFTMSLDAASVTTFVSGVPPPDISAPSVPGGVTAVTMSPSRVNLSWTPSTDNLAVIGYRIHRDGTQVAIATTNAYSDTGLGASTTYTYTVSAFDAAGNVSPQSASASATTLSATAPNITSLSAIGGDVGTPVTIGGVNFGSTQGASSVRFNGVTATVVSWSASSIVALVPNGAATGPVVVTVSGVASNSVSFTVTPPGNLPPPWASQDVGNPAVAGQATYTMGTFSVSGAGTDIWDRSDQFRFVYQAIDGDAEIVARVPTQQNTDAWAKAGVMIREDLAGSARYALAAVSPGNGISFQQRAVRGDVSGYTLAGTTARWVRLVRTGNTLSGYYSATGTAWTLITTATITLPTRVYVGLAVTSHNPSATSTATFSNVVTVSTATPPPNQAPILTQPANQSSAEGTAVSLQLAASDPDGNPLTYSATGLPAGLGINSNTGLIAGTPTYTSAGPYTVTATVSDGAASDSKTFSWTVIDVPQGPSITALSASSGAVGLSITISGANFGPSQGASVVRFNGTVATPVSWSSSSIVTPVPNGATSGPVVVTVGGIDSNGVSFTVTAPGALPPPWTSQDVGAPALSGQATYSAGTFTVTGAGLDIWDRTDQFRFVYQAIDGDAEIVARVDGLQNTDNWAKAGVMIREDLTGNAANVLASVTAANGISFQQRGTRGNMTAFTPGAPGARAPQWVRLVRSGNTLSGYYSATGTAWTPIATATMTLPTRVYVGLALTSHNPSATSTATFSNVTVSTPPPNQPQGLAQTVNQAVMPIEPASQASAQQAAVSAPPVKRATFNHDYDGDGRADVVTYQASTGEWRVLMSRDNYATAMITRWGTAADVPVPGDYDGDGRADMAYYRASTGTWSILKSSTNYTSHVDVVLGAEGDVPVSGDFDGDGMTDVAVYSPATGHWRILESTTHYATEVVIVLGSGTDRPVPGDYDGDGKTDPAVYRRTTGEWTILRSSTGYATGFTIVLGTGSDLPVPADYDGDGITDVAIFQPSSGQWQIQPSMIDSEGPVIANLGEQTDVPVPGDYDGDGRADLAVFHAGTWQILNSSEISRLRVKR